MKTDYKNINSFEVAVVSMIAVGLVIVGLTIFSSLTPRQQLAVTSAFELFDVHERTVETVENVKFVLDIPNEFYNQFYIAFTEVATLPSETIDVPQEIAGEIVRNIKTAFNTLSDQAMSGYMAQSQYHNQTASLTELAHDGVIMGAMIEMTDKMSTMVLVNTSKPEEINFHYEYKVPNINPNVVVDTLQKIQK
jgi:hypothetical protein